MGKIKKIVGKMGRTLAVVGLAVSFAKGQNSWGSFEAEARRRSWQYYQQQADSIEAEWRRRKREIYGVHRRVDNTKTLWERCEPLEWEPITDPNTGKTVFVPGINYGTPSTKWDEKAEIYRFFSDTSNHSVRPPK